MRIRWGGRSGDDLSRRAAAIKRSDTRSARPQPEVLQIVRIARRNKFHFQGSQQLLHESSTGFAHRRPKPFDDRRYNTNSGCMTLRMTSFVVLAWLTAAPVARAASDATLFRLFLRD